MERTYQTYLDKIIEFISDKSLIALRERYNEPSFFEIFQSKEVRPHSVLFSSGCFKAIVQCLDIMPPS